jgi:hypothetical protein
MQAQEINMFDRRQQRIEKPVLWNILSLAQKFSASSLGKFGYELCFVRNEQEDSLAVLTCNSGVAVITKNGDINMTMSLKIRS